MGLWQTHLFVWFAIIYEARNKAAFGHQLKTHANEIFHTIPQDFVWSLDHTHPIAIPHYEINELKIIEMAERLEKVKKEEILCGINIDRDDPVLQDGEKLIRRIGETLETLQPLYKLAKKSIEKLGLSPSL